MNLLAVTVLAELRWKTFFRSWHYRCQASEFSFISCRPPKTSCWNLLRGGLRINTGWTGWSTSCPSMLHKLLNSLTTHDGWDIRASAFMHWRHRQAICRYSNSHQGDSLVQAWQLCLSSSPNNHNSNVMMVQRTTKWMPIYFGSKALKNQMVSYERSDRYPCISIANINSRNNGSTNCRQRQSAGRASC